MSFKDYAQTTQEPLALPIHGKTYVIPEVPADVGLKLALLRDETFKAALGQETSLTDFTDSTEADLYRMALGTAYDDMLADKVPYDALRRAGMAAYLDFCVGREHAEKVWNGEAPDPKAQALTALLGQPPTETPTRTGGAPTTKPPASATGTSTRKAKSPADHKTKAKKASPSRGRGPSNAGTTS